jgi:GT2 family glycosyltransferase
MESTTDLVLLLDDDTVPVDDALDRLLREIEGDQEIAMVGPRICFSKSPERVQYEGGLWHFAGLPHMLNLGKQTAPGSPKEVDLVTSGCVLVRKQVLLDAGGFDENLFFLMEDVELCARLRLMGRRIRVVPEAKALNEGASVGLSVNEERDYPKRRVYFHSRNRCLVLLGIYRPLTLFLVATPLFVLEAAWLLFALRERSLSSYLSGKWDALRRLGGVMARRRSLASIRRLDDRVLLSAPSLTLTDAALKRLWAHLFLKVLNATLTFYSHAIKGVVR